jgi:hypothetical protein
LAAVALPDVGQRENAVRRWRARRGFDHFA